MCIYVYISRPVFKLVYWSVRHLVNCYRCGVPRIYAACMLEIYFTVFQFSVLEAMLDVF